MLKGLLLLNGKLFELNHKSVDYDSLETVEAKLFAGDMLQGRICWGFNFQMLLQPCCHFWV